MLRGNGKFGFFNRSSRLLSTAALMLFFYALFDGLLAYIVPIKITSLGFSKSQMGLIIASSNIFGAIFDFVLARFITNTNYRRLYLIAFGLAFVYPLVLWPSSHIPLFMIAMAIWGLYGDLSLYATFDFVSRRSHFDDHCQHFGILGIFKNLGYLIAPIVAGVAVVGAIDFFPFSLALSFILVTFVFYLLLVNFSPKKDAANFDPHPHYRHYNFIREFSIIGKVGRILFPVLLFNITIFIFDAVFWTIGPIFSHSFPNFKDFGGFFMTAYTLPVLIVYWWVGSIAKKFGKKRTAYLAFLFGSLFLIPICFINQPVIIIVLVFFSSFLSSIAWPAIDGAYADYISESSRYEKEIISLTDFSCNIGYIIGPILGGVLADQVGSQNVFALLGIFNIFMVLILLLITPKNIRVVLPRS
jgi:MFS family permease